MIYLIDGIPTTGKTTLINSIGESSLRHVFREQEYGNPLDISGIAVFTYEEFRIFLDKIKVIFKDVYIDDYEEKIGIFNKAVEIRRKWVFVHLNMLPFSNYKVCQVLTELMRYIPRNRFQRSEEYGEFWTDIWKCFLTDNNTSDEFWFECVGFQSVFYDLLGHYNVEKNILIDIYKPLIDLWSKYSVKFIIMEVDDISESFARATKERCNGTPTWAESFAVWVENSTYGREHGLRGKEGCIYFLEYMKESEDLILSIMPKMLYEKRKRRVSENA